MSMELGTLDLIKDINIDSISLSPADEADIFLTAIQDALTPEEYASVMENLTELELYGLIESAEIATEAKKIVYKQTKQMNLNREQAKAAFRLAKKANAGCWKKYHHHRQEMIKNRDIIFRTYGPKAKSEAKRVIMNSRKKASSMSNNTVTGKTISDGLDKKVQEYSSK